MMGDLELLKQAQIAKEDVIDPRHFGIPTKDQVIGTNAFKTFKASFFNGYMLIAKHPKYAGRIRWCNFDNAIHIDGKKVQNDFVFDVCLWIAGTYCVNYRKEIIMDILQKIAVDNEYNSILAMLNGKEWDRTKRIDDFLYKHLGVALTYHTADEIHAEQCTKKRAQMDRENNARTKLIRAYSRKFFLSSMARLLWASDNTPIDVHTVLCLYSGEQGIGKGFTLKALCLKPQYFGNTPFDVGQKDSILMIQGKQIYEIAELAKRAKDAEMEKAFYSASEDQIVMKWEKYARTIPRKCVFVATTNKLNILRDSTGSRRWWPVVVGETFKTGEKIDILAIKKISVQLWLEAKNILEQTITHEGKAYTAREAINNHIHGYKDCIWWLDDDEEKARIADRDLFMAVHPWLSRIKNYIDNEDNIVVHKRRAGNDYYFVIRDFACLYDALGLDTSRARPSDRTTIEMLLTELGFKKVRKRFGTDQITCWVKKL
tara:strand:+ start:4214 stop:5671 length:1458 start_codon:yes stop_codon:yes gene_type:complete